MSAQISTTKLSELICTRISHDLIGNIGAVANAVELLDEDADCVTDIKPILDISAHTLTSRLKFFRMAFGLDNAYPRNEEELKQICEDYLATIGSRNSPIVLNLQINTVQLYKIILPAVMVMGDIFIRGGRLTVIENNEGITFKAQSSSPLSTAKLQSLQDALSGKINEENPSQLAPLIYLRQYLQDKNAEINLKFEPLEAILAIG